MRHDVQMFPFLLSKVITNFTISSYVTYNDFFSVEKKSWTDFERNVSPGTMMPW